MDDLLLNHNYSGTVFRLEVMRYVVDILHPAISFS